MGELPQNEAIVQRCQATVARALDGGCEDAGTAAVLADLSRLPSGHPERGRLAAGMVTALVRSGLDTAIEPLRHLEGLLRLADADPPSDPRWPQLRSMARLQSLAYSGMCGQLTDFGAAEAELAALAETAGDRPEVKVAFDAARSAAGFLRAIEVGDESMLHGLPAELARYTDRLGDHPQLAPLLNSLNLTARVAAANQRGDHAEVWKNFELLREANQNLPAGSFLREAIAEGATRMMPFRQTFAGSDAPAGARPDDQLAALTELANRPGATDYDRALNHLALGGAFQGGGQETNLARIEAGIEHFRQALLLTPPDRPQHAFCLQSLALGLFRRTEVTGTTDGLDEAAGLLERARDLLGGPQHPQWAFLNEMLAGIRHRNGDIQDSGRRGEDAQRSYAWRVLLESDATGAKIAIRDAAQGAVQLARRHLIANNPAEALRALDTGRGLMLFAATELRTVAARLDAAGRPDLARRWETAGSDSGDLRREVLAVLTRQPDSIDSLLDPPSLAEIRSALAALDADALVYLVPGEPPLPGLVVIAPVDGQPAYMALPNLKIEDDADVEHYLAALAGRSRDADPAEDDGDFAGSVAVLCDWAWRAAIGPLLERYFARRPALPDGQVPRIVLIPMGDLARIPWPAARRGDGVYAVQLAAFSQAVSARVLCENAARSPVALSSTGLVVGDPDTGEEVSTLGAARLEAHAIRRAFYRGARYVGRRPDGSVSPSGRGTADQIRGWLADQEPSAGVLLHLACHGSFATGLDEAKSYLLLASAEPGGSGADELTAEEIMDLMAAVPERQVGLVVLAACHTGRSVHGYDEAYSLGTAFLAGGARSVLSTQWSIPDAATSSLMFLFHHYHRIEGLPPWQALRRAQMWMLDPHRQVPEGMPAELLALPDDEYADIVAWAGFVHYGQ